MTLVTSLYGGCLLPAALVYIVIKWSLPAKLLEGLQLWTIPGPDSETETVDLKAVPKARGRTSKHESRGDKAAKQDVHFPGSTSLALATLSARVIPAAEHYRALEALVAAWIVLAGTAAVEWLRALAAASAISAIPAGLAFVGLCVGLWALAEVDLVSGTVPRADKLYIAGLSLLGCGAAAACLFQVPLHILNFDVSDAADELSVAVTDFLSSAVPGGTNLQAELRPAWLIAALAVLAGAITALVASAGMRAARCLELAVRTPQFAARFITTSGPATVLLNLTMILPPLACILWVTPLSQELVHLSDSSLQWARAGVLLALGVLQLLAARLCTQAHLHTSLVQWWTHKHSAQASDASKASRMGTFIRMRAEIINVLFCKVAVQVAAPGLLWLSFGSVLALGAFSEAQQALQQPSSLWSSSELLNSTCGFLGWWTCCSWTVFTIFTLGLFRFGFLVT